MSDLVIPDDEIDINLRSAREVVARVIVLASLLRRIFLEDTRDQDEATTERYDLRHWLHDEGVLRQATADERRLIDSPLGSLSSDTLDEAALDAESLLTLGWAVGLADKLPPYDHFAPVADLLAALPQPWDGTTPFAAELNLRSEETIAAERERAELWLWRADVERDRLDTRGPERDAIESAIGDAAREAGAVGLMQTNEAGDLLLDGTPFRTLPAEAQESVALIAERRLHALNWLCGFGNTWDNVPLEV